MKILLSICLGAGAWLVQPAGAQSLPGARSEAGEVELAGKLADGPAETTFVFAPNESNASVICGDWTGSGNRAVGVRTADGRFLLRKDNSEGPADIASKIPGNPTGIAVAGRWKGGKVYGIGVFTPETGMWTLSLSPTDPKADIVVHFGEPGDVPVVGDWDGDGVDTIGVARLNEAGDVLIWILSDSNENPFEWRKFSFGSKAHLPVAGDWDGDGIDSPGLLNRTGGIWVLSNSTEKPDESVSVLTIAPELKNPQPFAWGTSAVK